MWKKIVIFALAVLVLAGALVALWPTFENMAFEAKLQRISDAWLEEKSGPLHWYHIHGCGCYYLGSENGYEFFYAADGCKPGSMYMVLGSSPTEEELKALFTTEIADNIFYPARSGELLAYCKDDPVVWNSENDTTETTYFRTLSTLYLVGKISKEAVDEAARRFQEYMDIWENTDPDDMRYAHFKYYWYDVHQEDIRYMTETDYRNFVYFRDRLEKEGLRIPDCVNEELTNQEN